MTFNIRYGSADDRINHWDHRKPLVIDRIKAFDPDLLGMQECRDDDQAEFIKDNLQGYEFYGVRREGGSVTALEMAPILFKGSAFELIQKGCFWLSETPQVPGSIGWGGTFPRTATWVELIHQASGRDFIFLNTHFDYQPSAIDGSARLVQGWVNARSETHPIIVTGDFNADKDSFAYHMLTEKSSLADIYRQIHAGNVNEGTFHGFGQAEELTSIDWMLASDHFEVISAAIDRYHEGDLFPSDHHPVTASLRWR